MSSGWLFKLTSSNIWINIPLSSIRNVFLDGKKYHLFGEGGVRRTATEYNKNFLCEIPIDPEVGKFGDLGTPIVEKNINHKISKIYIELAEKIKNKYSI